MNSLPEPAFAKLSDLQSGIDRYYSADQMRAYADAAVLSALAEKDADAVRLDFMCQRGLRMVFSRDGEVCTIWGEDEDHQERPFFGYPQRWFGSTREAIDAALQSAGDGDKTA